MARIELTRSQRTEVASKVMDWGNFVFVGLVISQIVPGPTRSLVIEFAGVITFAGAYTFAHWLMTRR